MVTDITRLLEQPLAVAPSPLKMRQHANRDETQYKHSARRLVYAATSEDARKVISALSTWFGGLVHLECLPDLVAMDTTLATSADGGADAGADAGASADIVAAKAKDAAAGQHFHILPVTAVVQFPAELEEMTVESLAELPGTAQAWRDCRAAGPPPWREDAPRAVASDARCCCRITVVGGMGPARGCSVLRAPSVARNCTDGCPLFISNLASSSSSFCYVFGFLVKIKKTLIECFRPLYLMTRCAQCSVSFLGA